MINVEFDYELLVSKCEYEIIYREQETECGKPAIYKVWWDCTYNGIDFHEEMLVCEGHFRFILAEEGRRTSNARP